MLGALPGSDTELANSRRIATLSMRLRGLRLRRARRTSASAYWASWADAPPMINARVPSMAEHIVGCLDAGNATSGSCLAELGGAASKLDRAGFLSRPSWAELQMGKRTSPQNYTARHKSSGRGSARQGTNRAARTAQGRCTSVEVAVDHHGIRLLPRRFSSHARQ